jgi:hypothetical protein
VKTRDCRTASLTRGAYHMNRCTTGTCPHERGVFIWLADGPWRGDPADPDYGRYPWVHNTTMIPGHLTVCELMPFATAIEAGETPMTTGAGTAVLANLPTAVVRNRVSVKPGSVVQLSLFDDAALQETAGGVPVTADTPESAIGAGFKVAQVGFPVANPLAPHGPAAIGSTSAPGRANRARQHDQHRVRGRRR